MRILKIAILCLFCLCRFTEAKPLEWKKPIVHTLTLLAIDYAVLVGFDLQDDKPDFKNFKRAFRKAPKKDDDSDVLNFVLHPLMGSETYLRAREANFNVVQACAFSMGASLVWEYLIESWTEHPSTQDLIFTTGIGWMIGELRYYFKKKYPGASWFIDPVDFIFTHVGITSMNNKITPVAYLTYRF